MGNRALFWDFDGTLVYCHHLWSGSVYRVLWDYEEAADVSPEQFFPLRAHGYPWEEPDEEAFRYQTSEGLWAYMHDRFERDFLTLGLMPEHAKEAAGKVRAHILNPRYYYLYEDTRKTLALCRQMGWENHLLSNNYPELPATMKALNLWDLFDTVTVSALDACSKPGPRIFETAREKAGHPAYCVMIGDNPQADIRGGKQAGMKTILVHKKADCGADAFCRTLSEIPAWLDRWFPESVG